MLLAQAHKHYTKPKNKLKRTPCIYCGCPTRGPACPDCVQWLDVGAGIKAAHTANQKIKQVQS